MMPIYLLLEYWSQCHALQKLQLGNEWQDKVMLECPMKHGIMVRSQSLILCPPFICPSAHSPSAHLPICPFAHSPIRPSTSTKPPFTSENPRIDSVLRTSKSRPALLFRFGSKGCDDIPSLTRSDCRRQGLSTR